MDGCLRFQWTKDFDRPRLLVDDSAAAILVRRLLDCVAALTGFVLLAPLLLLIALLVKLTSRGPALHWSTRIGVRNKTFSMPKFRTMRTDTPDVASHLLADPERYLTPIGGVLRRFSLDELPQLFSILKGDLSLIGPRPALYSQSDLIDLRTRYGIDQLVPGLTGWAQVNGRDTLTIPEKVEFERHYLQHRTLTLDAKILALTFIKVIRGEGVTH